MSKSKIYISLKDVFKILEKAEVDDILMHEITVHMDKHKLITLNFPIKSPEDLKLLDLYLGKLGEVFADFVADLKERYDAKDSLKKINREAIK